MHPTYAFGEFELDPARRTLTRSSGQPVPQQRYIVTVPRRGYQLVANVSGRPATNAATRREAPPPERAQASGRAHPVLLIAGAISVALNLLLAFWSIHRSHPSPRAAAVTAPAAAPVKSAWPIVERDKRELSTL